MSVHDRETGVHVLAKRAFTAAKRVFTCSRNRCSRRPEIRILSFACGEDQVPPPNTAAAVVSAPEPQVAQQPVDPPADTQIAVSESIRQKCDIPDSPREAPQFDFDRAELRPRGEGILERMAKCVERGSLEGKLLLVGHADPRGSDRYNQQLGMERAVAARDYLSSLGVPSGTLAVQSRGEQDAKGTDPASWQLDRRIDIEESTL